MDIPLQALSPQLVDGVSLANVSVLRLDRIGGMASGNKSFKLRPYLEQAKSLGVRRLLSFGGPWSNHLYALAAVGKEHGFDTIGMVRGEDYEGDTGMLEDARSWGMQIVRLPRSEYRQRNEERFLAQIRERFDSTLVIPEGGASREAMCACREIAMSLIESLDEPAKVVVPVGTGTTLAGIAAGLPSGWDVLGISALKGAADLAMRIRTQLGEEASAQHASWTIDHRFHCGGFAKTSPQLRSFVLEFEAIHGIPLDPVYTAKAMFAVGQMRLIGELDESCPVVVVHTGGLQGRRGQDWMPPLASFA